MESSEYGTQNTARQTWREQDGRSLCEADPEGQGGIEANGSEPGAISGRVFRSDRTGADTSRLFFLAGGILSQMVRDAETHLAEMKECVRWYEAKVAAAEQRVTHLRGLFLEQVQPTEDETLSDEE